MGIDNLQVMGISCKDFLRQCLPLISKGADGEAKSGQLIETFVAIRWINDT